MEELENRVFVLDDQLDSRKLADARVPAMQPTRVLRADPGSPSAPALRSRLSSETLPAPASDRSDVVTSIFAEHQVDYAGDAARPMSSASRAPRSSARRRPVLRLSTRKVDRTDGVDAADAAEPSPEFRQASGGTPGGRMKLYKEALQTMRSGRPDGAVEGFQRFVDENPQHDYADNALYWIGECRYDQGQFPAAARAYRRLVEQYPRGNKVPEAMLKLGFSLQALGDDQGGRAVLESLARSFPKHEAARLAAARLAHPEPTRADANIGGSTGTSNGASTLGTVLPAVPASPSIAGIAGMNARPVGGGIGP